MLWRSWIFSCPDIKHSRLSAPLLGLRAPEAEFVKAERKCQSLSFARLERDAAKAFQLPDRTRGRSIPLMNVNLGNSIACNLACARHIHRNLRAGARRECTPAHPQITEFESGVAQPVTKRVNRLGGEIPIMRRKARRAFGIVREIVVVVDRFLTRGARAAHRKLSTGIDIAKQYVRHGVPAFGSRIPCLKNCRHDSPSHPKVERPSVQR